MVRALTEAGITAKDRPEIDRWLREHGLEPNKENVLKWKDSRKTQVNGSMPGDNVHQGPHVELKITNENGTFQGTLHGKDAETLIRQAAPLLLGLKS